MADDIEMTERIARAEEIATEIVEIANSPDLGSLRGDMIGYLITSRLVPSATLQPMYAHAMSNCVIVSLAARITDLLDVMREDDA